MVAAAKVAVATEAAVRVGAVLVVATAVAVVVMGAEREVLAAMVGVVMVPLWFPLPLLVLRLPRLQSHRQTIPSASFPYLCF